MTRLTHSFAGFRRLMQMSSSQVFAFIEGKTDLYFYGEICSDVCCKYPVAYQIIKAEELPGETGGKATILSFFEYLEGSSSLISSFQGKSTGAIFFLDKDVDDLLNKKRTRSI